MAVKITVDDIVIDILATLSRCLLHAYQTTVSRNLPLLLVFLLYVFLGLVNITAAAPINSTRPPWPLSTTTTTPRMMTTRLFCTHPFTYRWEGKECRPCSHLCGVTTLINTNAAECSGRCPRYYEYLTMTTTTPAIIPTEFPVIENNNKGDNKLLALTIIGFVFIIILIIISIVFWKCLPEVYRRLCMQFLKYPVQEQADHPGNDLEVTMESQVTGGPSEGESSPETTGDGEAASCVREEPGGSGGQSEGQPTTAGEQGCEGPRGEARGAQGGRWSSGLAGEEGTLGGGWYGRPIGGRGGGGGGRGLGSLPRCSSSSNTAHLGAEFELQPFINVSHNRASSSEPRRQFPAVPLELRAEGLDEDRGWGEGEVLHEPVGGEGMRLYQLRDARLAYNVEAIIDKRLL